MKKRNGQLAALLLAIVMILSFSVTPLFAAGDQTFKDVPESAWYHGYVEMLFEKEIVKGYGTTGEFRPDNTLIREHAAKMIALAAGLAYQGKKADFPDVDKEGEMSPYIAALKDKGAIQGFPDGTFRPFANIERGHAAKIVAMAFGLLEGDMVSALTDLPQDADVKTAIKILESNGVVKGYGNTKLFKPEEEINRAEFAKILCIAMVVASIQKAEADPTPENIAAAQALADQLPQGQDAPTQSYLQGRLDELGEEEGEPPVGPTTIAITGISVLGIPVENGVLTAINMEPSGASVDYQWQSAEEEDGAYADIENADEDTYTVTSETANKWIRVKVTGKGVYIGTVYSEPIKGNLSVEIGDTAVPGFERQPDGTIVVDINAVGEDDVIVGEDSLAALDEQSPGAGGTQGVGYTGYKLTLFESNGGDNISVKAWRNGEERTVTPDGNNYLRLYTAVADRSGEEGDYTWTARIGEKVEWKLEWYQGAAGEEVLIARTYFATNIRVQEHSEYGFGIGEDIKIETVDNLPEGRSIPVGGATSTEPGTVPEEAKTALKDAFNGEGIDLDTALVNVTFKALEPFKELGYEKVRILPLEVTGPVGGTLQAWMYAAVQDKAWFDLVQTGWGSEGIGFSQQVDEASTMQVYIFADTPGIYEITFKAVDTSKDNEPLIAEGTVKVIVRAAGISVSSLAYSYYAAEADLEFTISGLKSNEEVRVGMPIFLGHGGAWPWASGEHVLTNMENRGDGLYWFGTTNGDGELAVSGSVGPDLSNGELHITLPDYGVHIMNPIQLQAEEGNHVRVGELTRSTYKFTYTLPTDPIIAGVQVEVPVTTEYDNQGDIGYEHVLIKFTGESNEDDDQVTFKITEHGSGTVYEFEGSGQWGPNEGWPLPADFQSTNTWTLIFPEAGNYTIKFWLEDLDAEEADKIIVEAEENVEVEEATLTLTFEGEEATVKQGGEMTTDVTLTSNYDETGLLTTVSLKRDSQAVNFGTVFESLDFETIIDGVSTGGPWHMIHGAKDKSSFDYGHPTNGEDIAAGEVQVTNIVAKLKDDAVVGTYTMTIVVNKVNTGNGPEEKIKLAYTLIVEISEELLLKRVNASQLRITSENQATDTIEDLLVEYFGLVATGDPRTEIVSLFWFTHYHYQDKFAFESLGAVGDALESTKTDYEKIIKTFQGETGGYATNGDAVESYLNSALWLAKTSANFDEAGWLEKEIEELAGLKGYISVLDDKVVIASDLLDAINGITEDPTTDTLLKFFGKVQGALSQTP